jgi:cytochrome c-type biogenesis protein CcmH/NrfG
MLFERIRRTQKPIFIFLGVMFGLGFVALGVGQGANSIDLGNLFSSSSSASTSISSLNSKVHAHPKDAGAWLALARAYEAANQTAPAITAYQTYVALKPKDAGALSATASLVEKQGAAAAAKAQAYQAAAAAYTQVNSATALHSLKLSPALTNPLLTTLAQPSTTLESTYETSAITDYAEAMALRQKTVTIAPRNPTYQILLARDAYATQSYATVAKALQAYLTLQPNLTKTDRSQLRQQILEFKLLAKSTPSQTSPSGASPAP